MQTEVNGVATLMQALMYLAYGGAVYIAGEIVSIVLETVPAWKNTPSWVKPYIVLVLSLVIALSAVVITMLPQDYIEAIRPILVTVGLTLVTWYSTQKKHRQIKEEQRLKALFEGRE